MSDSDFDNGYHAYCDGHKIAKDSNSEFIRGWWTAYDNREKFGEFDSFLEAE